MFSTVGYNADICVLWGSILVPTVGHEHTKSLATVRKLTNLVVSATPQDW